MTIRTKGIPPAIVRWVRRLDEVLYLRQEVADTLGVAVTTLKDAAAADPKLAPTYKSHYGRMTVYLYTESDVTALREHVEKRWPILKSGRRARKRGRPKLWDAAERQRRQTQQCRVRYFRSRARISAERGLDEVATDYVRRADAIRDELAEEYHTRFAYVTHKEPAKAADKPVSGPAACE